MPPSSLVRHLAAAVLVVASLAIAPATAGGEEFSGSDWVKMHPIEKYVFLSGFLTGARFVVQMNMQDIPPHFREGKAAQMLKEAEQGGPGSFPAKDVKQLVQYLQFRMSSYIKRFVIDIDPSALVAKLDALYAVEANRQFELPPAVYVAARQLAGITPAEEAALLGYLRTGNPASLAYTDDSGTMQVVPFP